MLMRNLKQSLTQGSKMLSRKPLGQPVNDGTKLVLPKKKKTKPASRNALRSLMDGGMRGLRRMRY